MMKKQAFVLGAVVAMLAGCSHSEYEGPDPAGGKLVVTASINQTYSRAVDAAWEAGDAIGINSDAGHDNLLFTTEQGDGVFTTSAPVYVLGAGEKRFTAYYPHNPEVSSEAPELLFEQPDDFLWSTTTASREHPQADFVFKHMMSKVSLTFTDRSATGDDPDASITLSGLAVSGRFHILTGDVTADGTKGSITRPFRLGEPAAIIIPVQEVSGSVLVTVRYQGKVYAGMITQSELKQGTEYAYEADLTDADPAVELSISSATITDWNKSQGGNIDMTEQETPKEENVLEVGDFLLNDGTVIDKNDRDFSKLKDRIVGVVYYVGNPQPSVLYSNCTASQDVLLRDAPHATHGLAIALENANNGAPARFASAKYNFNTWFTDSSNVLAAGYINENLNLTKFGTYMLGYNNTKVIAAAMADKGAALTGVEDFLKLVEAYNSAVEVAEASEWYLPSYAELAAVIANYDTIAASVTKAGGALPTFPDFGTANNETFYWTSDLRGSDYSWVSPLWIPAESVSLFLNRNSGGIKGYFRLSIAF